MFGFECRLNDDSESEIVDLQLGCGADQGGAISKSLAGARRAGELPTAWEPVAALVRDWVQSDSPLRDATDELWCELDRIGTGEPASLASLVPSVFLLLRQPDAGHDLEALFARTFELLEVEVAPGTEAAIKRCQSACPPGAWISHLGVMLGRQPASVRIHVADLRLAWISEYLERIGWAGETERLHAAARLLLDHCDRVVLCLDMADELLPRIGLEAFFVQRRGLDPRWPPLLERLVSEGMARPERASSLLDWPGVTTPPQAPEAWPEAYVVADLQGPPDRLGVLERRLSHVKLTLDEGAQPRAKAYFGAGRVWWRSREDVRPVATATVTHRDPAESAQEAIDRGVAFLLERRNQAGWWRDFFDRARPTSVEGRVLGYSSDEWVSAYVATALSGLARPEARAAAGEVLELLLARRGSGGWGYHGLLPADADTTTWVLRLAASLEAPTNLRLDEARAFVAHQTDAGGGVATYPPQSVPELTRFLEMSGSYEGWCGAHLCVTAAAAAVNRAPASVDYVRHAQHDDGRWSGHWWDDDEYTTLRAVEIMVAHGRSMEVDRAVAWAAGRVAADGGVVSAGDGRPSPFATALAASTLATADAARQSRQAATDWLVSQQLADGSWAPSARLRVPAPDQRDPMASPATTLTYLDDEAVFTTATVVAALAAQA